MVYCFISVSGLFLSYMFHIWISFLLFLCGFWVKRGRRYHNIKDWKVEYCLMLGLLRLSIFVSFSLLDMLYRKLVYLHYQLVGSLFENS